MRQAVLCTPLRVEQAALRRAGHSMRLVRTGMGPRRAATTAATLPRAAPVLVAGVAAAQAPHLRPGDVVVATEVRATPALPGPTLGLPNSTAELFDQASTALLLSSGNTARSAVPAAGIEIPSAPLLAGALRGLGLRVHLGPIRSVPRIAWGKGVADGSIAVDMESAQLAGPDRSFAVVRVIVDTPDHPLWQLGTLHRGVSALRMLRACCPALEWWAAATGPRQILLAAPGTGEVCHHQRAIARQADLVLVVGSPHPVHLVQIAQQEGVPAHLVNELNEIDLRWLIGRTRLAITAGASAVPHLVDEIVYCLGGLGRLTVSESRLTSEDDTVAAPKEVI